jgi:hypothetical protein
MSGPRNFTSQERSTQNKLFLVFPFESAGGPAVLDLNGWPLAVQQ